MTKEYIEREALLKDIEEERPEIWTDSEAERQAENDFYKYRDIVKIQPAADVVEVVRCKDCEHCEHINDEFAKEWYQCVRRGNIAQKKPNDFCSYGKRREGADK